MPSSTNRIVGLVANVIDVSAPECHRPAKHRLEDGGIIHHRSEMKRRALDCLKQSHLLAELARQVHLWQHDAMAGITPDLAR